MRQALQDVVTGVLDAGTFNDSLGAFFRGLAEMGFEKALYVAGERDPETGQLLAGRTRFWSFPERELDAHDSANHLAKRDAALRHVLSTQEPFYWGSPRFLASLDEEAHRVNSIPKCFRCRDGYSIPIVSLDATRPGGLTILRDRERALRFVERLRLHEDTLLLLVHWFHVMVSLRFAAGLTQQRPEGAPTGPWGLSTRERECLRSASTGLTSKEISARLNISERTVNLHIGNAMHKLRARSRAQAIAQAMALGELEP